MGVREEEVAIRDEEIPMEQDTIVTPAKFDEAMMEEYDEDAVGDEFLEELTTPLKNINKQSTNNQMVKTNRQTEEKKSVDLQQMKKKQLWGGEEDGCWYASSAKIVSRSPFHLSNLLMLLFVLLPFVCLFLVCLFVRAFYSSFQSCFYLFEQYFVIISNSGFK